LPRRADEHIIEATPQTTCCRRSPSAPERLEADSLEITHACRLRKKLALAGAPHLVHNTRGVGYRLSVGSVPAQAKPLAVAASRNGHAA
jgi:hypothetical protein